MWTVDFPIMLEVVVQRPIHAWYRGSWTLPFKPLLITLFVVWQVSRCVSVGMWFPSPTNNIAFLCRDKVEMHSVHRRSVVHFLNITKGTFQADFCFLNPGFRAGKPGRFVQGVAGSHLLGTDEHMQMCMLVDMEWPARAGCNLQPDRRWQANCTYLLLFGNFGLILYSIPSRSI